MICSAALHCVWTVRMVFGSSILSPLVKTLIASLYFLPSPSFLKKNNWPRELRLLALVCIEWASRLPTFRIVVFVQRLLSLHQSRLPRLIFFSVSMSVCFCFSRFPFPQELHEIGRSIRRASTGVAHVILKASCLVCCMSRGIFTLRECCSPLSQSCSLKLNDS